MDFILINIPIRTLSRLFSYDIATEGYYREFVRMISPIWNIIENVSVFFQIFSDWFEVAFNTQIYGHLLMDSSPKLFDRLHEEFRRRHYSSSTSQRSQNIDKTHSTLVQTDRMVYAVQLLVVSERGDPVNIPGLSAD